MVTLAGVRKSYRGRGAVLAGVDLRLEPGVPVVVAGENGSGKSTLLRIVAGCARATEGTVIGRPPVVGYLPAHVAASAHLPVRRYLRHHAAMHGVPDRSAAVLARLRFTGALDAPATHLSTGNAQKVGIAQALACEPGLLVLDEPWAALDGLARLALDDLVLDAADRGAEVLIADHTGAGARLDGVRRLQLADGLLRDAPAPPRDGGTAVIVARSPGPLPFTVLDQWRDGEVVTLRVPADVLDPTLAAMIDAGCSVQRVWREEP